MAGSILVNGILYFWLFGHLDMTSSKYQNLKSTWNHLSHADRWSWLRPFWPPPPGGVRGGSKWPKKNLSVFWGLDTMIRRGRKKCLVILTPTKFEALSKFPEGFGHRGRSILVNGILYFRLFGHFGMTSSKYQNVKINFDSGSNLRRALGNMYHHVIHDSMRQARVSCLMEGFPRVWVSQGTPKQPYQLCFELLLLPGAWNHVSPCDTLF